MKKLLLVLILIPCLVQAEVVRVGITWASNRYSLKRSDAKRAYRMAARVLRKQTDAKLKLVSFQASRDIARRFNSGNDSIQIKARHDALDRWRIHFGDNINFRLIQLVIAPPLDAYGRHWVAGASSGICTYGGKNPIIKDAVVIVNALKKFVILGGAAIEHEIGHAVGAWHDDNIPASAMHPNSLFYTKEKLLDFSSQSIAEIDACLN